MQMGTDPEFFILNSAGRPVPAHRVVGDKHHKEQLRSVQDGAVHGEVFRDGYAVEFNIVPATCREGMAAMMNRCLYVFSERLKKMGFRLTSTPAVRINLAEDLRDAPEDVLTFGCDPSWDAYTGETKTPMINALTHEYRYAGGHMHFSTGIRNDNGKFTSMYPQYQWMLNAEKVQQFVKMMDLYVGVPLTALFAKTETFQRREYYGQAGEFRYQEYKHQQFIDPQRVSLGKKDVVYAVGVEYRTPGPEVWNDPAIASLAFGLMRDIANRFDYFAKAWDRSIESQIQAAINKGTQVNEMVREYPNWISKAGRDYLLTVRPFQSLQILNQDVLIDGNYPHRNGWQHYTQKHGLQ